MQEENYWCRNWTFSSREMVTFLKLISFFASDFLIQHDIGLRITILDLMLARRLLQHRFSSLMSFFFSTSMTYKVHKTKLKLFIKAPPTHRFNLFAPYSSSIRALFDIQKLLSNSRTSRKMEGVRHTDC